MKDRRKKKNLWIGAVCCLCLLLPSCGNQDEVWIEQSQEEMADQPADGLETTGTEAGVEDEDPRKPQTSQLYVQVSGAVHNPGVYELPQGSRVFEAVAMAGGLTDAADGRLLNQAQPLSDGQMIYVYAQGEVQEEMAAQDTREEDGRVNLNTASLEQLMGLPGIGQAKAEGILAYRKTHGAFGKIEDVMEIEGIKEGVFSKIKDRIKVD
ncbi:MAG: ComEA family DNA-binding protein [Lachnospiraceae bacterium]|nr:ComEA family DNA-binding protein [Lachnospiraceae bacterium]